MALAPANHVRCSKCKYPIDTGVEELPELLELTCPRCNKQWVIVWNPRSNQYEILDRKAALEQGIVSDE